MKGAGSLFTSLIFRPHSLFFSFAIYLISACSPAEKDKSTSASPTQDSVTRSNISFIKDCKVYESRARKMDSTLMQELEINKQTAAQAIKAFTDFADYCHNDSLAPIYYLKTAQVARAIENIPLAKEVLERCLQKHPHFRNKPAALFFLAQLYDEPNYLNNEQEALRLYQQIVDEYPRSEWAMSARGAMQFIGKTDEEMIKEFDRRNKQKPN